jgi:hypothetical protein
MWSLNNQALTLRSRAVVTVSVSCNAPGGLQIQLPIDHVTRYLPAEVRVTVDAAAPVVGIRPWARR